MKTKVEKHFDRVAKNYDLGKNKYSYYYDNLKKLLGSIIPGDAKVFEVGCGTGDLLVSLDPKSGYGMDISDQMIQISKLKYQNLRNIVFSTRWPEEKFDYIFMSDVIEHLERPEEIFKEVSRLMDRQSLPSDGKKSKFIITMANPIWEPLLMIWEKIGLKMTEGPHKRIRYKDIKILSEKTGMKIVKHDYKLLIPVKVPVLTNFINKYLEKYFKRLAFIEYFAFVKP